MKIQRLRWAVPAIAFLLFAIGLAMMVATPAIPQRPDAALACIDGALTLVEQLGDDFMDLGGGQRHSVAALAQQGQRVRLKLRALGALPGQGVLSVRLGEQFEAAFRQAMQARLAVAETPGDPVAALAAARPFFASLQADLQEQRLAAQGRWFDSAWASRSAMRRALALTVAVAALLGCGLALLAWRFVHGLQRSGRVRPAVIDPA